MLSESTSLVKMFRNQNKIVSTWDTFGNGQVRADPLAYPARLRYNGATVGFRSTRVLERGAAADLWRVTLLRIPSVYGRMVYLSSLRDANNGRYQHYGLAQAFGDEESHRSLASSHTEAFRQWLNFDLEQQKADLDLYISSLEGDRRALLYTWRRLRPYEYLIPAEVRQVERELYLADLHALLGLLMNEHGVADQDPEA
jgi:hypothetical protein